jgi:sensor histidine kinase YesM
VTVAVLGVIVGLLSLALAFVVHAVIVARWSARLQTLVEIHSAEIGTLRTTRHEHANAIATLQAKLEEHLEGSR